MGFKHIISVVAGSLIGVGCYTGGEAIDAVDEIEAMRSIHNNTVRWNSVRWNDITWNGVRWNDSSLDGSSLTVKRKVAGKWEQHGGPELIGSEIDLEVDVLDEEGQATQRDFVIRIDDVHLDETLDDLYYYDLSLGLKGSDAYEPLCESGDPAILLRNYWDEQTGDRVDDPDVITFACTSGVLAHCTQWGYRPWHEAKRCTKWNKDKKHKDDCETVSLADYHQACTRMARADYCGTGEAWTVPGTPIDIYDHLFDQIEAPETNWPVEAEWTPDGAYCLDDIRQQAWEAEGNYPHCAGDTAKKLKNCGTLTDHRALLVSKYED